MCNVGTCGEAGEARDLPKEYLVARISKRCLYSNPIDTVSPQLRQLFKNCQKRYQTMDMSRKASRCLVLLSKVNQLIFIEPLECERRRELSYMSTCSLQSDIMR